MTAAGGGQKYIFAVAQGKMSVIDANDPTSPTIIHTVTNAIFNQRAALAVDYTRSILWVHKSQNSTLGCFDISNLTSISNTPLTSFSNGKDGYAMTLEGDYLYITHYDGLDIYDISNGGSTTTSDRVKRITFGNQLWFIAPVIATDHTYTNSSGSGRKYLFASNKYTGYNMHNNAFDITTPSTAYHATTFGNSNYYEGDTNDEQNRAGWSSGAQVVVTASHDRDAVNWYDASTHAACQTQAEYIYSNTQYSDQVHDPQITTDGDYTFWASSNHGFVAFDTAGVASGTSPTALYKNNLGGWLSGESCHLNSTEEYCCVSSTTRHEVAIFDVSNPSSPSLAGNVTDSTNLDTCREAIWYEP